MVLALSCFVVFGRAKNVLLYSFAYRYKLISWLWENIQTGWSFEGTKKEFGSLVCCEVFWEAAERSWTTWWSSEILESFTCDRWMLSFISLLTTVGLRPNPNVTEMSTALAKQITMSCYLKETGDFFLALNSTRYLAVFNFLSCRTFCQTFSFFMHVKWLGYV